jgi:hypothetical protein
MQLFKRIHFPHHRKHCKITTKTKWLLLFRVIAFVESYEICNKYCGEKGQYFNAQQVVHIVTT